MAGPTKKDGFGSKVAVGVAVALIVAAVLGAVRYFAPEAWGWMGRQADHLGEPVAVSRWWHWLLVAYFAGTLLAGAGVTAWALSSSPEHHAYVRDRINGADWHWQWWGESVVGLWCRCAACGRRMTYEETHDRVGDPVVILGCQPCGIVSRRPGFLHHAKGEVEREIDLKVHNGSWRQVVESQKKQVAS